MSNLAPVTFARGAGPLAGLGRALGALRPPKVSMGPREAARPSCPPGYQATNVNGAWRCLRVTGAPLTSGTIYRPVRGLPEHIGIGAVDLTDQSLMGAAQALSDYLTANGCSVAVIPEVQAFQQAWIAAGGTLPNDTGGRSPIDGFYGANTAAALQQMFTNAPDGCVGAAPSGAGPVATTNPTQSVSTAVLKSQDPVGVYFADMLSGGSSLWWTLGIVGVVAVVGVANPNAFKMYTPAKSPRRAPRKRAKRATRRRARKAAKRSSRGNRRRNPVPPPFSRSHARHETTRWTKRNTEISTYGAPIGVIGAWRPKRSERTYHVVLMTDSGATVLEWRGVGVRRAVERGDLDPRDYHGSALRYANRISRSV